MLLVSFKCYCFVNTIVWQLLTFKDAQMTQVLSLTFASPKDKMMIYTRLRFGGCKQVKPALLFYEYFAVLTSFDWPELTLVLSVKILSVCVSQFSGFKFNFE